MKISHQASAEQIVEEDLSYIVSTIRNELEKLRGKHLLITGAAGFLGYYLVQTLLRANENADDDEAICITAYDNFMRGVPGWLNHLKTDPHLTLVRHDIREPLPNPDERFDFIIHAASIASPIYYRKYPLATMDANVNGLRHLLEHALEQKKSGHPIEGFLFFSTSEIYGDPSPSMIPTPETYRGNVSCTGPRACYDESKRYGETLCVTFASQYELPITIARPFNNYGPGLKISDRRVIPDFMRDVLNGDDIVMLSDGSPSRTFCYISDAICGYFKTLVNGRPGEPYNIGVASPEISIMELAEKIVDLAKEYTGYSGKVIKKQSSDQQYLVDNPNRRCPVIKKAETDVEYNPTVSLEEGLVRNLLWYKENKVAEDA